MGQISWSHDDVCVCLRRAELFPVEIRRGADTNAKTAGYSETYRHANMHAVISEDTAVPSAPTLLIPSINLDTIYSCIKTKQLPSHAQLNCWTDASDECFFFHCMISCLPGSQGSKICCVKPSLVHLNQVRGFLLYCSDSAIWSYTEVPLDLHLFSVSLLWKTWQWSGDDFILISEGHLCTRLSLLLLCPSQVDLAGDIDPSLRESCTTDVLYSTYCTMLPAVFAAEAQALCSE